jgi:MaoC dehydratase-like protein/short subunit dehydrogenase
MMPSSFGMADQTAFARLSGDHNPLHLDPIAARRTMFGRVVVHGIHAVLRALDTWMTDAPAGGRLTFLRATFPRAIGLEEPVEYVVDSATEGDAEIRLTVRGSDVVVLKAGRTPASAVGAIAIAPGDPAPTRCREMALDDIPGASGTLPLVIQPDEISRLFPSLAASLPRHQLGVILATTRLVGMECPGLRSVFGGLALAFADATQASPVMEYRVTSYQAPLSRLVLEIRAPGCTGTITAFVRPGPAVQPSVEALRALVNVGEFADQRALVVGGSRGLGEVAAKLLAAGGASVRVTYHRGAADAARVVEEIRRAGGTADCIALDVLGWERMTAAPEGDPWTPTHLYYFATPPIFTGGPGGFSPSLYANFTGYYVTAFSDTIARVVRFAPDLRGILYPSSVAVDDTPAGMAEYAAAKADGEAAARALAETIPGLLIMTPRLPRLATDQTATFLPVSAQDPAPVLVQHLRDLSRRTATDRPGLRP